MVCDRLLFFGAMHRPTTPGCPYVSSSGHYSNEMGNKAHSGRHVNVKFRGYLSTVTHPSGAGKSSSCTAPPRYYLIEYDMPDDVYQ